MNKIVILGGTGLIGGALAEKLRENNFEVGVFGRNSGPASGVKLDLGRCVALINLAGANIGGRPWTTAYKKEILDSRIESTRNAVELLKQMPSPPKVFINASAVGIYGEQADMSTPCDENSSAGDGFLSDVCVKWEAEALKAKPFVERVVMIRTSLVLSSKGGALQSMVKPFKLGLGGAMGDGRQPFPWIHIDDEVNAILFCINNEKISGPINLVSPERANNKEFSKTLAKVLNRPAFLNVPKFLLKTALGDMSQLFLAGQNAVPKKLLDSGFKFTHPNLEETLKGLVSA